MTVGERIKSQRELLGLSQEELAKKLNYKSRSTINKIEMGINDITQSKIVAFAKALNTTTPHNESNLYCRCGVFLVVRLCF